MNEDLKWMGKAKSDPQKRIAKLEAENERLKESLIKIHDRSSDGPFCFFESAYALEYEPSPK